MMPPASDGDASGIAARLDRLPVTRLHGAVIVVCALGLGFDVIEAALSNALSAVFSAPPHQVVPYQLSLLLASVFAGGAVGAPLLGFLADRHGRRSTLRAALLMLTLTSMLAATSASIEWLIGFRVLSGIALGAYPPLMVAYLSDVLPPARRGMLILITGAIGFLGAPAVIFLVRWLTPLQPFGVEAWRWALIFGAAGAAGVAALFWFLPESPRWLAAAGRHAAADANCRRFERSPHAGRAKPRPGAPMRGLPASPRDCADESQGVGTLRVTQPPILRAILLGALYFFSPWATIGFPLLSGAVLIEKGFRVADSLLFVGIAMFGPSIGALLGSFIIDRVERRTALALTGGAMAVFGLGFAAGNTPVQLMGTGIAFNLVGAIYVSALSVYAAELFPTRLRAAASSGAWAVNRVTSALVPLALLPLLKAEGAIAMFIVIAGALVAGIALVLAFGPRGLARRPVE